MGVKGDFMAVPKIGRRSVSVDVLTDSQLEGFVNSPGPVVQLDSRVLDDDPEQAAEVLLPYLPEDTQLLIKEAQVAAGVPLWQMFLGYVMIVSDRAELFAPYLLAAWEAGKKPNEARPCGTCGGLFKSRFAQAKYCCAPCHFNKLVEFGHTSDCPTGLGAAKGA